MDQKFFENELVVLNLLFLSELQCIAVVFGPNLGGFPSEVSMENKMNNSETRVRVHIRVRVKNFYSF